MLSRRDIAALILTAAILGGALFLILRAESSQRSAETGFVRDAVREAALTCYAVEGAYPADLQYLRDHYGLAYNEEHYRVTYDAFAANLFPEIHVVEVEAG